MKRWWMGGLCCLLGAATVFAEVRLPALFGDNMVLQRGTSVPVWGTAAAGEKVTVTLGEQRREATADGDGKWMVRLDPLTAGGPLEMTVAGGNTITLRNVLVGEVWVCSGQSNMVWWVKASANAEKEIAAAHYPDIRFFTVKNRIAGRPQAETVGEWTACSPKTVPDFSAVGYYFGRHLHQELKVPVGLIATAWGGTPAESWMSRPALENDPDFAPILERWSKNLAEGAEAVRAYAKQVAAWAEATDRAEAAGDPLPDPPEAPRDARRNPHRPAGLYNAMIHPLIPYAIQGAIWYQGESNAGRAYQYRKLFPALIRDWRQAWGQGEFPFLFVQLANFMKTAAEPGESAWAELREAQAMALSLPKTGMAVAIDIGEANDIHPKNKQDVGRRLALAALAICYGRDIPYSGPVYESMSVEGAKVRLRFKHLGGGLVAKDGPLKGFAVAGADRKFAWAEAEIDGDTVVVHSDAVSQPVAVRYAWGDNPVCNLYNQAGLPAVPFRTDDWPGLTAKEK